MLWYKKCHKKSSNAKQHYHLLFLKYAKQHHLMIKYDQNFNTSDIISLKAGYNRLRERERDDGYCFLLPWFFTFLFSLLLWGFGRERFFATLLNGFFLVTGTLFFFFSGAPPSMNLGTTPASGFAVKSSSWDIALVVTITFTSPLSYVVVPCNHSIKSSLKLDRTSSLWMYKYLSQLQKV